MKKIVLLVLAVALIFSVNVMAAKKMMDVEVDDTTDDVKYMNNISANVWPWIGLFFNAGYERALIDSLSVRVRGDYWGLSMKSGDTDFKWYGVGADIFWHPAGRGLAGFYLGPKYDLWVFNVKTSYAEGSFLTHWIGAMGGNRWVFDGGFSMAIGLGAVTNVANSYSSTVGSGSIDQPFKGFLPGFDFELGYAF